MNLVDPKTITEAGRYLVEIAYVGWKSHTITSVEFDGRRWWLPIDLREPPIAGFQAILMGKHSPISIEEFNRRKV